jgi:hypothetical protein
MGIEKKNMQIKGMLHSSWKFSAIVASKFVQKYNVFYEAIMFGKVY